MYYVNCLCIEILCTRCTHTHAVRGSTRNSDTRRLLNQWHNFRLELIRNDAPFRDARLALDIIALDIFAAWVQSFRAPI